MTTEEIEKEMKSLDSSGKRLFRSLVTAIIMVSIVAAWLIFNNELTKIILVLLFMVSAYLSGCVLSYNLAKNKIFKRNGDWLTSDRIVLIVLSLGSYLSLMLFLAIYFTLLAIGNDGKSKW
jgi:uncharacterized membrane protein YdbT with pleckstrin-like domain